MADTTHWTGRLTRVAVALGRRELLPLEQDTAAAWLREREAAGSRMSEVAVEMLDALYEARAERGAVLARLTEVEAERDRLRKMAAELLDRIDSAICMLCEGPDAIGGHKAREAAIKILRNPIEDKP